MRPDTHPDDGVLLAYLDARRADGDDPGPAALDTGWDVRSVETHLGGCAACGDRLERMEALSLRLAALFAAEAELPIAPGERAGRGRAARPHLRAHGWVRAAAAAAVLLAVALTPAGAMLTGWVRSLWSDPTVDPPGAEAPGEVRFEVAARDFEVRVLGDARGARFVIIVDRVPEGIATSSGVGPASELVLGDARLDVRAAGEPGAVYRITLPERVGRITLRVGDRVLGPEWTPNAAAVPRTWTVTPGG